MKKFISFAICAIMMVVCSTAVQAQTEKSKKQRMSREELADKQARHIAHKLALDDATTQKFVKTFCDYQKDVWALDSRVQGKKKKADMTDAEVEQAIKTHIERSHKILDLREKYYKEYNKFLTPKQIQRVYEMEKQTMKRLGRRGKMDKHPKKDQRPRRSSFRK